MIASSRLGRRSTLLPLLALLCLLGCSGRQIQSDDQKQQQTDTAKAPDLKGNDTMSVPDSHSGDDMGLPGDVSPGDVVTPSDSQPPSDSSPPIDTHGPDVTLFHDIKSIDVTPGGAPVIAQQGDNKSYLIRGVVVTMDPDQSYSVHMSGEVRVEGNKITCVGALNSCGTVSGTTVIESNGVIFPGLIDTHNHIMYSPFSENDVWEAGKLFYHHDRWTQETAYNEMQDAYNYLLSASVNVDCEMVKYGEIKSLLGGTTSVVGSPKGSAQKCFSSLARSIDGSYNDLEDSQRCGQTPDNDHIQVHALGLASGQTLIDVKANLDSCKTWSYVVHVGEGVHTCPDNEPTCNSVVKKEWQDVISAEMDRKEVTIVHGTVLSKDDFKHMYEKKMKLVWSPKSNIYLYDQTTRINLILDIEAEAKQLDPNAPELVVALAPDWSIGGSVNLLDELNFAYAVDQSRWGGRLSFERLVRMVTIDAAKALEVHESLGSITVNKYADLIVIAAAPKTKEEAYQALVGARPTQLGLVMVNGVVLHGNADLLAATSMTGCDTVSVCGESKFLCVAETGSETKIKQTYSEIVTAIENGLTQYKTANPGKSDYLPLAPIVTCP